MNEEIFQIALKQIQELIETTSEEDKRIVRESFERKCEDYDKSHNNNFVILLPKEIKTFQQNIFETAYKQFIRSPLKEKEELCTEINIKNSKREILDAQNKGFMKIKFYQDKKLKLYCEMRQSDKSKVHDKSDKEYLLETSPKYINSLCA